MPGYVYRLSEPNMFYSRDIGVNSLSAAASSGWLVTVFYILSASQQCGLEQAKGRLPEVIPPYRYI